MAPGGPRSLVAAGESGIHRRAMLCHGESHLHGGPRSLVAAGNGGPRSVVAAGFGCRSVRSQDGRDGAGLSMLDPGHKPDASQAPLILVPLAPYFYVVLEDYALAARPAAPPRRPDPDQSLDDDLPAPRNDRLSSAIGPAILRGERTKGLPLLSRDGMTLRERAR